MSFTDLIGSAQPAMMIVDADATEGRSWSWGVELEYSDGTPADLLEVTSTVCEVYDAIDGTVLVTLDAVIVGNTITVTATPLDTAGVAGQGSGVRLCPWRCTVTDGADVVDVWGVQSSRLTIHQGA